MKTVIVLAALAGMISLGAGCGQRGPLHLPDTAQPRPVSSGTSISHTPAR